MYDLRTKHSLSDAHLSSVCKGKRGHVGGWTVPGAGWEAKKELAPAMFTHPQHGDRYCLASELSHEFGISDSSISSMRCGRRKTAGGWTIKKEPV